jgi:hypothetical protein
VPNRHLGRIRVAGSTGDSQATQPSAHTCPTMLHLLHRDHNCCCCISNTASSSKLANTLSHPLQPIHATCRPPDHQQQATRSSQQPQESLPQHPWQQNPQRQHRCSSSIRWRCSQHLQ